MKILILGHTGFLGKNLFNFFNRNSNHVISVSREVFFNDIKFLNVLKSVSLVINCIGASSVVKSFDFPHTDFDSNVLINKRILDLFRENKLDNIRFINLSSAAVYGNPKEIPINENSELSPLSPYGFHKLITEYLLKEYAICFKLKTLSLRIFSAYGEGQQKLLFWDLHQKIQKSDGLIELNGTGNETRDYIHVLDIGEQINLVLKNSLFQGETVNIANGEEISILNIVKLYQKYYPKKFEFKFNGQQRIGDPKNWCADISSMKNWGYKKSVNFEDGIKSYIKSIIE